MNKKFAEFSDTDGNTDRVGGITPDLADALIAAIRNETLVERPQHAHTFDDITETLAQTSRVLQHLEAYRELLIVAADETSPHADRKALAIAAGFPASRLYRVLERHGRPKDRKSAAVQEIPEDD